MICLTGAEFQVELQIPESSEKQHMEDSRHPMARQKARIADSDERSLGYETMTTESELGLEVSLLTVHYIKLHKMINIEKEFCVTRK